jgi:phospholipid/cholesterol/gamma-HCH transport system substrate-binding protein
MFKGDRNFAVGLFVSIAIAVLVTFIIWLTGRSGNEEMTRYSLKFDRDVSGLAVGGPVKYMGMNVGSVVHMSLDTAKGVRVRVDIDVLADTPVTQGTYASLALQGITGVAVVNLATEPGEHPPLPEPPRGEYPVIPVRDVGFAALLSSAPEIMNKLDNLLGQANELLGMENRDRIGNTLQHIEDITASLATSRDQIAALPGELSATLAEIQATVSRLQGVISELQPGLAATVDNLERGSGQLANLASRFDSMLQKHEEDLDRFLREGLGDAPALLRETRATLRDLEKLLNELQDDPSLLIYRPPDDALEIEP